MPSPTPAHAVSSLLSPATTAALRAIYQDHKRPEHKVGFSLSRQEGQTRKAGRVRERSEIKWERRGEETWGVMDFRLLS